MAYIIHPARKELNNTVKITKGEKSSSSVSGTTYSYSGKSPEEIKQLQDLEREEKAQEEKKQIEKNTELIAYEDPEAQKSYFYKAYNPPYLNETKQKAIVQNNKIVGFQDPKTKMSYSLEKQRELANQPQQQRPVLKEEKKPTFKDALFGAAYSGQERREKIGSFLSQKTDEYRYKTQTLAPGYSGEKNDIYAKYYGLKVISGGFGALKSIQPDQLPLTLYSFTKPMETGYSIGEELRQDPGGFAFETAGGFLAFEGLGKGIKAGTPKQFSVTKATGDLKYSAEYSELFPEKPSKVNVLIETETKLTKPGAKQPKLTSARYNSKFNSIVEYGDTKLVSGRQTINVNKGNVFIEDRSVLASRDLPGDFPSYKIENSNLYDVDLMKGKTDIYPYAKEVNLIEDSAFNLNPRGPREITKTFPRASYEYTKVVKADLYEVKQGKTDIYPYAREQKIKVPEGSTTKKYIVFDIQLKYPKSNIQPLVYPAREIGSGQFLEKLPKQTKTTKIKSFGVSTIPGSEQKNVLLLESVTTKQKPILSVSEVQTTGFNAFSFSGLSQIAKPKTEVKVFQENRPSLDLVSFQQNKSKLTIKPVLELKSIQETNKGVKAKQLPSLDIFQEQNTKTLPSLKIDSGQFQKPKLVSKQITQQIEKPLMEYKQKPSIFLPGKQPKAFRFRSIPNTPSFEVKPLRLDIFPIADLFSANITEARTGRKATQQATTKRTKREYGEYIRSGSQIFPTKEIKEGKVKLFNIKF